MSTPWSSDHVPGGETEPLGSGKVKPPLLADSLRKRDPLEQVVEAMRLKDHADDVRPVGFVVADQLRGEDALCTCLECLQLRQPRSRRVELLAELQQLRALGIQVGLDPP